MHSRHHLFVNTFWFPPLLLAHSWLVVPLCTCRLLSCHHLCSWNCGFRLASILNLKLKKSQPQQSRASTHSPKNLVCCLLWRPVVWRQAPDGNRWVSLNCRLWWNHEQRQLQACKLWGDDKDKVDERTMEMNKKLFWVKITWVLRQGWQGTNPATTPRVLLRWPQQKSLRRTTPTSRRPLHQVQDQGGLRWVVRRCRSTERRSLRVSSDLPRSASDWEDHQAAGCWLKNQRGKKIGKCNLCSSVMLCGVHVLYIAVMLFVVDVFWFCFKRCYLCSIEFVSIKYLIVKCHVIFAPREIWAPDIFSNVDGNGEKRWILSIVDLTFWVMSTWRFEWCR